MAPGFWEEIDIRGQHTGPCSRSLSEPFATRNVETQSP